MIANLDPTTTVGLIITALTGIGFWIRRERASWAQNDAQVAESKYSTAKTTSELAYLEKLNVELNDLRRIVITHTNKIASLESLYVPIKQHVDNIVLCETCTVNNKLIINALHNALDKVGEPDGHNH